LILFEWIFVAGESIFEFVAAGYELKNGGRVAQKDTAKSKGI
jgi:hypothetical protein